MGVQEGCKKAYSIKDKGSLTRVTYIYEAVQSGPSSFFLIIFSVLLKDLNYSFLFINSTLFSK